MIQALIDNLQLQPHPEGGYYKENYRSSEVIEGHALPARFMGRRNMSTAIYYLLQQGDFSAFHKIKSDECWHFYAGGTLIIHMLSSKSGYNQVRLGNNFKSGELFQWVVEAGVWFASEPANKTSYSLTGCTVAPGFDFADFEMADSNLLLSEFPDQALLIKRLCR